MNGGKLQVGWWVLLSAVLVSADPAPRASARAEPRAQPRTQPSSPTAPKRNDKKTGRESGGERVRLDIQLPKPAFRGTPKHVPPGTNLEKPRKGPRPPLLVPKGTRNVAAGKPVTSSDDDPIVGETALVTDGDKEASEGSYVELGPGAQHVQIDLGHEYRIHAIVIWHYHADPRVYHDVVVQTADDRDFITNVRTLFNNDHDNSSGLGLGEDKEYWDTYEGKLIDVAGVKSRYVRLTSNGSTADDQNHYTEVEVYGLPAQ